MKIVFMGTPDFAVPALKKLVENNYHIAAVITAPDKPSGRGLKMNYSAVKEYALSAGLKVLQPEKLKNPEFIQELKQLNADLQIVVAFRMLPEVIWKMPPLGTFNLHASLLPQYRGAAPINYAIINGEKKTGVTTFFLQHEIDTGNIIKQQECIIGENETAGELHDRLMNIGADLVLETVRLVEQNKAQPVPQKMLENGQLKVARKIFKDDCLIHWNQDAYVIHNFIRGLSPYPTAFTYLVDELGNKQIFKIYNSLPEICSNSHKAGTILTDTKTYLKIVCNNGCINLLKVQLAGKKAMPVVEFLRGFNTSKIYSVG
ncbi:MAG: methionyl-tRNA formyltransferase [Bacteroidia bacterium]|nr:methionyl-tRNA formyltransferase [Bacteroidia bacterium]